MNSEIDHLGSATLLNPCAVRQQVQHSCHYIHGAFLDAGILTWVRGHLIPCVSPSNCYETTQICAGNTARASPHWSAKVDQFQEVGWDSAYHTAIETAQILWLDFPSHVLHPLPFLLYLTMFYLLLAFPQLPVLAYLGWGIFSLQFAFAEVVLQQPLL